MAFSVFYNRIHQMLNEERFESLVLTYIGCHWNIVRCIIAPNMPKVYELIAKINDENYNLIINYNSEISPEWCLTKTNMLIAVPTEENIVNMTHFLCSLPIRQVPMCLRNLHAFLRQNESIQENLQYKMLLGKGFAEKQIDYLVRYEHTQNEEEKKRYDLCVKATIQTLNSNNTVWKIEKWNKNHNLVTLTNLEHNDNLQLLFRYFSDASVWYYNASERIDREENKEFDVRQFAAQVLVFYQGQIELRENKS